MINIVRFIWLNSENSPSKEHMIPPATTFLTIKVILCFFVMTIVSQNPFTLKEKKMIFGARKPYTLILHSVSEYIFYK